MTCFCSTSLNITVSLNHPQILRRLRSIDSLRAASGKRVKISPCVGTAQGSEKQPSRVCPTYEPSPKHSEKKTSINPTNVHMPKTFFSFFPLLSTPVNSPPHTHWYYDFMLCVNSFLPHFHHYTHKSQEKGRPASRQMENHQERADAA